MEQSLPSIFLRANCQLDESADQRPQDRKGNKAKSQKQAKFASGLFQLSKVIIRRDQKKEYRLGPQTRIIDSGLPTVVPLDWLLQNLHELGIPQVLDLISFKALDIWDPFANLLFWFSFPPLPIEAAAGRLLASIQYAH